MRIENFRKENKEGTTRIIASVTWEDCQRPPLDVYLAAPEQYAQDLTCRPDGFLAGCLAPALYFGEKRIKFDRPICPQLREGMITNMDWLRYWHGWNYTPLKIEAPQGFEAPVTNANRNVALMLSGGVDSLYTLRQNRLSFPLDHPGSIKDCFLVHGFDIHHDAQSQPNIEIFNRAVASMRAVADEAKVNLIPVYTNIRHLYSDKRFWLEWFFGAGLAFVAHGFVNRINRVWFSSDSDVKETRYPLGSHPMSDNNFSSCELTVFHSPLRTRLEKVKTLAEWDVALHNLRVCTANQKDWLNCGECEKCLRTMVMLLALGKLDKSRAFRYHDISPELLRNLILPGSQVHVACYYKEAVEPLAKIGRYDLVRVLKNELGTIGKIRRFDHRYLNGSLVKTYALIRRLSLK